MPFAEWPTLIGFVSSTKIYQISIICENPGQEGIPTTGLNDVPKNAKATAESILVNAVGSRLLRAVGEAHLVEPREGCSGGDLSAEVSVAGGESDEA